MWNGYVWLVVFDSQLLFVWNKHWNPFLTTPMAAGDVNGIHDGVNLCGTHCNQGDKNSCNWYILYFTIGRTPLGEKSADVIFLICWDAAKTKASWFTAEHHAEARQIHWSVTHIYIIELFSHARGLLCTFACYLVRVCLRNLIRTFFGLFAMHLLEIEQHSMYSFCL